jgi:hypothetical protein
VLNARYGELHRWFLLLSVMPSTKDLPTSKD